MISQAITHATLADDMLSYLTGAKSLIEVIIGFGFLIFIHELGHFLVAKWCGVRCPQFAIGFGTAILSYRPGLGFRIGSTEADYEKHARESLEAKGVDTEHIAPKRLYEEADKLGLGETEYRLNYVPLGGYVKMVGQEDMDPSAASDDPRSFTRQAIWKRAAILSAGVTMNLIFGMLFLIIAFMAGVKFPPSIIGGVGPDTPAATTYAQGHPNDPKYRGLEVGDRVVSINGNPARDFQDIQIATALDSPNTPVRFGVQRSGVDQTLYYNIMPTPDQATGTLTIGVASPSDLNVKMLTEGSDLARQGLTVDTTLSKLEGKPVTSYGQFYHTLIAAEGRPLAATFVPNPKAQVEAKDKGKIATQPVHVTLAATPLLTSVDGQPANLLGMVPAVAVQSTTKDSPAAKAKIKAGDLIARVGTLAWPNEAMISQAIKASGDRGVDIAVWRDGKQIDLGKIKPNSDHIIGVSMLPGFDGNRISGTLPGSPAAAAHLPNGSAILAINGTKVHNWSDMQRILAHLKTASGKPARVSITCRVNIAGQPVETHTLTLAPDEVKQLATTEWIPPLSLGFGQLHEKVGASNPLAAAILGVKKTKQFMVQTYISLLRLVQGSVSPKQLRGPVGIVQIGADATQYGWEYLFFFLGIISINLAVLNFLPLPIVDGGHIVFLIIEKIKGSPVSAQIQVATMVVGLVLIGGVMLMATYNDIARLVTG